MPVSALFAAILALACSCAAFCQEPTRDQLPRHLVHVLVADTEQMSRLEQLDLDLAACAGHELHRKIVDVIATDRDLERLRQSGLQFAVVTRDLEQHYARALSAFGPFETDGPTPPLGQGAMGGHWNLTQMEAILDQLAVSHPNLCSQKVSIGNSIEGRSLWMVKISDNVSQQENEPELLYTGLHHAREPLSMETVLVFMNDLLDGYGSDPEATFLINERQLYFVPCVNPDGYERNWQTNPNGGGLWRKNRRVNGDGTIGVDLNRNYTIGWNAPNGGNSQSTSSETYRGPAPLSEPETQALDALAQTHNFVQVMNCHSYTDVLLRPWGYQTGGPANVADYDTIGDLMTASNGIAHGPVSQLLYVIAGGATDHFHSQYGAYAWLPELGRSNEGGFWPNPTQTVDIATRHQPMLRAMALTSGAYLRLSATVVSELNGNGNGQIEAGESGSILLTLDNGGAVASGQVNATLSNSTPGVTLGTASTGLPSIGSFSSASPTPLTFTITPGFAGLAVELVITVTGDGRTTDYPLRVSLIPARTLVLDDMERDRGFRLDPTSTATTGNWERAAPQQTSSGGQIIQPGSQHTPGGNLCWVTDANPGTSAGNFDVDGGFTELRSPRMDLSHLTAGEVSLWRWYGESQQNDPFSIGLSRDGGSSWETLLQDSQPTGSWIEFRGDLGSPLTNDMQFRFVAQDLNPSLVEAAIDDFAIEGIVANGAVTQLASAALGTDARLGVTAPVGGFAWLLSGFAANNNQTFPGVSGSLLLPASGAGLVASGSVGTTGSMMTDVSIPNAPQLVGLTIYWQGAFAAGNQLGFGPNVQSMIIQ